MPDQYGQNQHENREPVLDDDLRVYEHADGDEEDGAEEVLDGLYDLGDVLSLYGLGQDTACHEGAEGRTIMQLDGEHDHQEAEAKRHDEQCLTRHQRTGLAQKSGDDEDTDNKPYDQH